MAHARIESDSIGSLEIPENVYYGVQTERGCRNFDITGIKMNGRFIKNIVRIKKAAAIADTPRLLIPQSGYSTALLALDTYENASDKSIFSDSALLPVYLRASQAERELAEKEQAAK